MSVDRSNFTKCGEIYITDEGKYWYFCGDCEEHFEHVEGYEFHYLDMHFEFEIDKSSETSKNITHSLTQPDQKNIYLKERSNLEECKELSEPLIELTNPNEEEFIEYLEVSEQEIKSEIDDSDSDAKEIKSDEFVDSDDDENLCLSAYKNKYSCNENDSKRKKVCLDSQSKHKNVKVEINDNMDEKNYIDFIKCNFCEILFSNMLTLKIHEHDYHLSRRCNLCQIELKTKKALDDHVKKEHFKILNSNQDENLESSAEKGVTCEICQRYFNDEFKLIRHIVVHTKPGVCPICKKKTNSLKFHIKKLHPNYKKLQCKICKKLFRSSHTLLRHSYTHENSSETANCKVCGKKFKSFSLLDVHLISVHANENKEKLSTKYKYRYPCTVKDCKKIYPGKTELTRHMLSHSGERPFKCTKCPATFSAQQNLKMHLIYKHLDSYNYPCTYENCNKKFKTSDTLKRHINYLHIRAYKYKCDQCDKSFLTASNLGRHKLGWHIDPELWKHQCQICKKKFSVLTYLKNHMVVHSDERPFICDICESSFSLLIRLKEHMRIHSGKKHYKCTICSMEFAQSPGLSSHMKNKHRK